MRRIGILIWAGIPFTYDGNRIFYQRSRFPANSVKKNMATASAVPDVPVLKDGTSDVQNGLACLRSFIKAWQPNYEKKLDAKIRFFNQEFNVICRNVCPPDKTGWTLFANGQFMSSFDWQEQDAQALMQVCATLGFRETRMNNRPKYQSPRFQPNEYEFSFSPVPERGFVTAFLNLYGHVK